MADLRENPHKNRDPITDNCLDCGAFRGEIEDGMVPICQKVTGRNRIAIIIGLRELRHRDHALLQARRRLQQLEESIPPLCREIRATEELRAELAGSIELLKQGD